MQSLRLRFPDGPSAAKANKNLVKVGLTCTKVEITGAWLYVWASGTRNHILDGLQLITISKTGRLLTGMGEMIPCLSPNAEHPGYLVATFEAPEVGDA